MGTNMRFNSIATVALACAVQLFVGCGQEVQIATVKGQVVMDGNPVAGALVVFQPEHGRPSNGKTDDQGQYELNYSQSEKGAVVGLHSVRITTGQAASTSEGKVVQAAVPEKLPARYNSKSELTADVTAGDNEVDFTLESK